MTEFKTVSINMASGSCDAHLVTPKKSGKYPAVLFLMDAYGPRKYLFEMAEKIARAGYIVLLPNLLYRIKPAPLVSKSFPILPADLPEARSEIMALLQKYDYKEVLKDIDEYLKFLASQQMFNRKTGITGYCMGGSLAIRTAALYPSQVQAAASFHGGKLVTAEADSPHLLLAKIKASLYVAHADQDPSMPQEQIEVFNQAFADSGLNGKTEKYSGALHGFTMADLPAGNSEAIAKHWSNLFSLFEGLQA